MLPAKEQRKVQGLYSMKIDWIGQSKCIKYNKAVDCIGCFSCMVNMLIFTLGWLIVV